MQRIKPGAACWEVRTLPLCYYAIQAMPDQGNDQPSSALEEGCLLVSSSQPPAGSSSGASKVAIGPVMPSSSVQHQMDIDDDDDDDGDDDDIIGPRPPKPGEAVDAQASLAKQFEARADKMKKKLEGKDDDEAGPAKREKW